MTEAEAMTRAIELAWRGWGRVAPNPLVGAVVLRDGQVVGEGWHAEFGGPHAERMALDAAGAAGQGGTLVVTLEPCAHQGKQPPCAPLVLERGIRRLVLGHPDPNPEATGGARWLADRGLDVTWDEAARPRVASQLAPFLHAHAAPGRARVEVKLAASLDGFIADHAGAARWVSGPEARAWVQWLRAGFDGLAVGGRTARTDDPALTVRGPLQPRIAPRRIVVTRGRGIADGSRLAKPLDGVPTLVVQVGKVPGGTAAGAVPLGIDRLADLPGALHAEGIASVLVEGGGALAGALLEADLVDRVHWIAVPTWLGGGTPAVTGLAPCAVADARRWQVRSRRALGGDTLITLERE